MAASRKQLEELKVVHTKASKKKETLAKTAARMRSHRLAKERKLEEILEKRPDIAEKLLCITTRPTPGRPTHEQNDALLAALQEIAILGAVADDRRNSELIRSVKTLDDFTTELTRQGFTLKRSAVYFRLVPRRWNTVYGKTHITTVPVKLRRASNDARSRNQDR